MPVTDRGTLFPSGTPYQSHNFKLEQDLGLITVVGLKETDCVRLERAIGEPCDRIFVPVTDGCCDIVMCGCDNQFYVAIPGTYRLVFDSRGDQHLEDPAWFEDVRAFYEIVESDLDLTNFIQSKGNSMSCGPLITAKKEDGCLTIVIDGDSFTVCDGNSVSCSEAGIIIDGELCSFPEPTEDTNVTPGNYSINSDGLVEVPLENGNSFTIDVSAFKPVDTYLDVVDDSNPNTIVFRDNNGNIIDTIDMNRYISEDVHLDAVDTGTPNVLIFRDNQGNVIDSVNIREAVQIYTDDTITGDGTSSDPLSVVRNNVVTDETINGNGTQEFPLHVDFNSCQLLPEISEGNLCGIKKVGYVQGNCESGGRLAFFDSEPLPNGYESISESIEGTFQHTITGVQDPRLNTGVNSVLETILESERTFSLDEYPGLACEGTELVITPRLHTLFRLVHDNPPDGDTGMQWGYEVHVNGQRIGAESDNWFTDKEGIIWNSLKRAGVDVPFQYFARNQMRSSEKRMEWVTTGDDMVVTVYQYLTVPDKFLANSVGYVSEIDLSRIGIDVQLA